MSQDDHRCTAPAALRNRGPILDVLRGLLPETGLVLEIASGTGQHVVHFARELPQVTWQPSDPSDEARKSIAAWTMAEGLVNVRPPLDIDAADGSWPVERADAIVCINMTHISPWGSTVGLMKGAGRLLPRGSVLYLYGPYRRAGRELEPTNAAFDHDLRARNPQWGLRNLDELSRCAQEHGLRLDRVVEMPANNLSVVFRKE